MYNTYQCNAAVACGTDLPIINVTGSAAARLKLFELIFGFSGSPADQATVLMVERTTDVGTGGTTLTETKGDPLIPTPVGAAIKGTFGAAPTDSDELLLIPINQRSTWRWVAMENTWLVSAAAAGNGIMVNSESSTATPTLGLTMRWGE